MPLQPRDSLKTQSWTCAYEPVVVLDARSRERHHLVSDACGRIRTDDHAANETVFERQIQKDP